MVNKNEENSYSLLAKNFSIDKFTQYVFYACVGIFSYVNITQVELPILEAHGFRQTQTALTAYWLSQNGFSFAFETPVVGEAWSIPFEFPIYQLIVAFLYKFFGYELTNTGRIVSVVFTVLTCVPIFKVLSKLDINGRAIYISMSAYLISPIYLFWGGTFMIESTALFFTMWSLYYSVKIIKRSALGIDYALLFVVLTCAVLQKVTTVLPVVIFIGIFLVLFRVTKDDLKFDKSNLAKIVVVLVAPMLLGFLWVKYTDVVKMGNPIGSMLTSESLKSWNFGVLGQRFSVDFWRDVVYGRVIKVTSFHFVGIFFLLYFCVLAKDFNLKRFIYSGVALFILPFLIFSKLHAVHDYYQFANGIYWIVIFNVVLVSVLNKYCNERKLFYVCAIIALLGSNLFSYNQIYGDKKSEKLNSWADRTLKLASYIKQNTKSDDRLIIYGFDWSSELAFYSQRKSLTLPWGIWDFEAISNPQKFLKGKPPSLIVNCPNENFDKIGELVMIVHPKSIPVRIVDCDLYHL